MDDGGGRLLNVSLLAGSPAQRAYYASGLPSRPPLNLRFCGGRTIADLVFVNHYLGGAAAWDPADMASVDAALAKAMTDHGLQSVIRQYFDAPISSRMLPSAVRPGPAPAAVYKDQAEALAARIYRDGGLDGADPDSTVINIMLPRVFQDVDLADGSGAVPVQLMWSNHHAAPATRLP
jgi:hypothetical protein